jgi:hypothetical protein
LFESTPSLNQGDLHATLHPISSFDSKVDSASPLRYRRIQRRKPKSVRTKLKPGNQPTLQGHWLSF